VAVEIKSVRDGSIGAEMDIEAGDILLLINDQPVNDILDYQFYTQDDNLLLEVQKPDQEIWQLDIEKNYDEDLGLEFEGIVFDKMKACSNNCIFCFVNITGGSVNFLPFKGSAIYFLLLMYYR